MGLIDGLGQDCSNPGVLAMESLQSSTKPLISSGGHCLSYYPGTLVWSQVPATHLKIGQL